jgi:hypothetical protein
LTRDFDLTCRGFRLAAQKLRASVQRKTMTLKKLSKLGQEISAQGTGGTASVACMAAS